jgi:taurine dioxygenase
MKVERMSAALGGVVSGLDLSADLSNENMAALREALGEHLVLFFRDQTLTPHQQSRLATRFGALYEHPFYSRNGDAPGIIVFDHGSEVKASQNDWHTDVTYAAAPPKMSLLYGEIVPPAGGDTLWASMYAAYDALSFKMQTMLESLSAIHDIAKDFPPERFVMHRTAVDPAAVYKANPPVSHPVIRTHPQTDRKALYVNSSFTTRIEDLHPRESAALLEFLFAHVGQPEFQIRWKWTPGDVAFWDNHWTQHYAVSDYFPERRRVRRATIMEHASV